MNIYSVNPTMTNSVKVLPYNPEWPQMFEVEAALIKKALGENCIAVHHIGSTAVPGLSAKPVIDILPVVKNILHVDNVIPAMEQIEYQSLGEYGIPFRRFFQKPSKTHHVHVFEQGNPEIERHLLFRDWMRHHDDDRNLYAKLKTELALKFPHDIKSYVLGKDDFINAIDAKTGFDGLRMVRAVSHREWEAARHFRQKYFFGLAGIQDPYTWTFEDPKHVHFILYKGAKIIGYAHIPFWPDNRAALRIIVIDEPYRNQGFGSEFLKKCERWLSQQKIKKLVLQSSPQAYAFYCKHGYTHMEFNDPDGHESHPQDIEVGKNFE